VTIRRRLSLAFVAILILMGTNQVIFIWSSQLRTETLHTLDRALTRQVIISNVQKDVDNLHKEVTLLSQLEEGAAADPDARALFNEKVDRVSAQVKELRALASPLDAERIHEIDQTYAQLAVAWKRFYQYLGASQGLLFAELVRADPLSQRLLMTTLPRLDEEQQARVREAKEESVRVAARTDSLSLGIFALSTLLAGILAYRVAHQITHRIGELNVGSAIIGGMSLDHRIAIKGKDELSSLGRAFNDMAEKLQGARNELTEANQQLASRNSDLDNERQVSESLLLNILPSQVAHELETKGSVEPRYYEDVTIVFTDFVGFTLATERLAAEDLVRMLNDYFTAFDEISKRYGLEKLKTIGDSYLAVGGMPERTPSHPVDAVMAAFDMVEAVRQRTLRDPLSAWSVRIGVHTGAVVAGVVGIQKFAFDVWGETVNFASRIESAGSANQINVSGATYLRIKDFFECEHRGKVLTKEKREVDMYFVRGLQPSIKVDDGVIPPPTFARRYRTYFQKDPASFPASLVSAAGTDDLQPHSATSSGA
jgi:class 3 adenylate cyclase/HAMP domain-containing protein